VRVSSLGRSASSRTRRTAAGSPPRRAPRCGGVSIPPPSRSDSRACTGRRSSGPGRVMRRWFWWAVQIAIATLVVRMVWGAIVKNWGEFRSLHVSLAPRPGWIALSVLVVFLTYALQIESWRRLLARWTQHLSYRRAARIWLVVNLGRYVPGKVWSVAGLIVLAQRAGVESWAAGASAFAIQAIGLGTAVAVVAAAAPSVESPLRLVAAALVAVGEVVLIGLLTPALGSGGAVALSVGSRVLLTLTEVAAALAVLLVTGRTKEDLGVRT